VTRTETGSVLWLTGLSGAGKSTVAAKLAKHGVAVLVAAISPYRQARDQVRTWVDQFVEVHVAAPLPICARRDPKGLYAKALAGDIQHFTGVSDPYEPPPRPELVRHTEAQSVDDSVHHILAWLEANQLTTPTDP
jgi:adenylylsulfate kinase-like enzyme